MLKKNYLSVFKSIYHVFSPRPQIRLKQQAQPGGEGSGGGSFDMSPTNSVGGNSSSSPTTTNAGKLRHKNSFRVKGILNKLLNKDRKAKSCENLQVL